MPAHRGHRGKPVDRVRALLDAMTQDAHGASTDGSVRGRGDQPIEGVATKPSTDDKPRKRLPTRRARKQPRRKEHAPEHAARRIAIERAMQRGFSADARYFGFLPPPVPMARSRRSLFVGMTRLLVMPMVLCIGWWLAAHALAAAIGPGSWFVAGLVGFWIAVSATILVDALLVTAAKALFAKRRRRTP